MDQARVQAVYQEIETLLAPVKLEPELGATYFRQRLSEADAAYQRTVQLLIETTKALNALKIESRTYRAAIKVDPNSPDGRSLRDNIFEVDERIEDAQGLLIAIRLRKEGLRMSMSNVRLMEKLMAQEAALPRSPADERSMRDILGDRQTDVPAMALASPEPPAHDPNIEALLGPLEPPAPKPPTPTPTVTVNTEMIDIADLLGGPSRG